MSHAHASTADAQATMRSILQRIATGPELSKDISRDEARLGMRLVLDGAVDPVQAGIFLIALRMKRETDEEFKGVLDAILEATGRVSAAVDDLVDIADPYDGFNRNLLVSPFLPALLAALGIASVTHGTASVGPKFGATHAAVLRAAGVAVDGGVAEAAVRIGNPAVAWSYVDQSAFCPRLHALRRLRELIVKRPAITTVEVLAGPVRARSRTHLMTGYVHKPYPRIYAMLARHAGFDSALLVRGIEGGVLPSLRQSGKLWRYTGQGMETDADVQPGDIGIHSELRSVPLPEGLPGFSRKTHEVGARFDPLSIAQASAEAGMAALAGSPGPARDALVYGAALCQWHLGRAASLPAAAELAREALDGGRAMRHLEAAR